jgi:hypothetical protein
VSAVAVSDGDVATWQQLLAQTDASAIKLDGVSLYRISVGALPENEDILLEARTRFDEQRIRNLVRGVQEYLSRGGKLDLLSAVAAPNLGIIPREALIGPKHIFDPSLALDERPFDPRLAFGVWLAPWPGGRVSIGEFAWYPAIRSLMDQLRPIASAVSFVDPSAASPGMPLPSGHDQGVLLIVFTREQLAKAAALLTQAKTAPYSVDNQ